MRSKPKAEKNRTRFNAKEKALERLEKEQVERPKDIPNVHLHFKESVFEAHHLIRIENVGFSYGDKQVFQNLNLTISRGDRVAVIGPNGSGKTTLLKMLSKTLQPRTGSVIYHPRLRIGYFAHNLNDEETILDTLLRLPGMAPEGGTEHSCRLFLPAG